MDQRSKHKTSNYKTTGTKCKRTSWRHTVGKDFLYKIPKVQAIILKTDKQNYIRLKRFYAAKDTIKIVIRMENIFTN